MIDGQIEPIPMPGDDAFDNGFLSKSYGGKVIGRLNRPLTISPLLAGTVLYSEENVFIVLFPEYFTNLIANSAPMTNDTLWLAVDGVPTEFDAYLKEVQ